MNLTQLPQTVKLKSTKLFLTKQIIAVSALSLITISSFAQKGFDFGVKGIIQSSSLFSVQDQAAGNELNYKDRLGIGAGVGAGYSFTKHVGAEIDILYSPQGSSYNGEASLISGQDKARECTILQNLAAINNIPFTGSYKADVFLNYIKIPILFRYNMKNTKRVYYSMFLGPQFDMLSSASIKINGHTVNSAYDLKTKDMFKKSEVDGVLGLGLGINLSKNFVLTGHLRFDFATGDAEDKSAKYTVQGSRVNFYNSNRGDNMNVTGGGMISLNYKLVKKEKEDKKKMKGDDDTESNTKTKTKAKTKTAAPPSTKTTNE